MTRNFVPAPGHERNQLKRHRNFPCPCGSGKKVKRCHGQLDAIPAEHAEAVREYLTKLGDFGFIKKREKERG